VVEEGGDGGRGDGIDGVDMGVWQGGGGKEIAVVNLARRLEWLESAVSLGECASRSDRVQGFAKLEAWRDEAAVGVVEEEPGGACAGVGGEGEGGGEGGGGEGGLGGRGNFAESGWGSDDHERISRRVLNEKGVLNVAAAMKHSGVEDGEENALGCDYVEDGDGLRRRLPSPPPPTPVK